MKSMFSIKKHKKALSSVLLTRGLDSNKLLLISGVRKKILLLEKGFSRRLARSCLITLLAGTVEKNHLYKVENILNCFNSVEKFDLLIKSKVKLSFCSVYYKKLIFTDRMVIVSNNLFWIFIKVKLISILMLK